MRSEHGRSPKPIEVANEGLTLAVWEWAGAEPTLLFAHATSFHGRCWDAVIREFPGRRCVAIEARGHGRSSKPAPPYHWGAFARDLTAIADALGVRSAIGIGHSAGGHSVAAVAASRPEVFSALVLVDPTIRPPEAYDTPPFDVSFVRKRRVRWSSPDEMFERFRGRGNFDRWKPEVLRDYCEFGLLRDGDEFVLACPPEVEASIYESSKEPETRLHDVLGSVRVPVKVLRAGYAGDLSFSTSPTDPGLASRFPNGEDVLLDGYSHFIPMEGPEVVVRQIRRVMEKGT